MTTTPEWERLASELELCVTHDCPPAIYDVEKAAAELRRLGPENTKQVEQIKAITHLVTQLHQAKGRYHTQLATCALFDAFGLPNVKPEKR